MEQLKKLIESPIREVLLALTFLLSLAYGYGGYRAKEEVLSGVVAQHTQEIKDLSTAMNKLNETIARLDERIKLDQTLHDK